MLQTNTTCAVMTFNRNVPGSVVVELSRVSDQILAKLRAMHPVALLQSLDSQWCSDRGGDRASRGPRRFPTHLAFQGRQGQEHFGY